MGDTPSDRSAGNILVVDDDLEARQILEALLTREGYEVRCAPNGQLALMFSREDPPELILLDVRLPDVGGFEVCRRLNRDPVTRAIPVIFISGLDGVMDKVQGFSAGGVDFITKPFQADEVLARIQTHLTLKRLREQAEDQTERLEQEVERTRQAEASLRQAHEELEKRVEARTVELENANRQLAESEKQLSERLKCETLLADISARFIGLQADRIDGEIQDAQRSVCECHELELSALWQWVPGDPSMITLTHLYLPLGGPEVPDPMEAQAYFPWCLAQMRAGKSIVFSSMAELPADSVRDQETWRYFGIKSTLGIPLTAGGGPLIGAVSFHTVREERQWPADLVKRLDMVAQIFANALLRKRMEEELKGRLKEIEDLKDRLENENVYLQEEVKLLVDHSEIVGQSAVMKELLAQAEQVAATDATVLILGETGTGKELFARAIHGMSGRGDRTLITVNCASLPPTLIESELFGREKGAYTGALTQMVGRFELADGSTLFLDEIGEFPSEMQSKLLRVLEEGSFERLGSTKRRQVDVRIIAATNRDIPQDVKNGVFRKDLYYRLNVFPISIPPLRERPEDIPLLVWAFIRQYERKMGKRIESIPRKCMEALKGYHWPGNVRELKNVVEHSMILNRGNVLKVDLAVPDSTKGAESLDLQNVQRQHLIKVLQMTEWRVSGPGGAAEILGLKRTTLQSLMKRLNIERSPR